ncbi:PAS domain-containing sensor histidine kinase [Thalassospira xiamenensis]|uniref:PAS domain-containing sensor histidine kinase n=1 Tax=Thalassospira xiamenensis TaxID=220697 RepID=UPI000DEE12DC|nr:PAS domain-containing sensor histidine kinase [Thalassospira xiamenensis]RCK40612.1 histidine kinase [Thalassospira xiamenensis]
MSRLWQWGCYGLTSLFIAADLHAQEKFRVGSAPEAAPNAGAVSDGASILGSFADLSDRDWLVVGLAAIGGAAIAGGIGWRLSLRMRRHLEEAEDHESELADSTEQFTHLFFAGPDPVYYWSQAGFAEGASPSLKRAFQLGKDGRFPDVLDQLRDDDARTLKERVRNLKSTHERFELWVTAVDERKFHVTGAMARKDRTSPVLAHALWFRDETRHTRERESQFGDFTALKREVSGLRLLIDSLPFPVWRRDGDLRLIDCNAAYATAVELDTVKDALARQAELGGGVIPDKGKSLAASALRNGETMTRDYHIVIKGDRKLLRITECPSQTPEDLDGLIGFAIDCTAIEELQSDLSRHIRAHAEVLENLGTAIAIYGGDKRLIFFNTAFTKLWDMDEDWLWAEPSLDDVLRRMRDERKLPEVTDFTQFRNIENQRFTDLLKPEEDLMHLPNGMTLRRFISPHPFGGLMFAFEDVTDKLVLESSYNTLIAVQRETLENLHEAVGVISGDGRLRLYNHGFADVWGLEDSFLSGAPHISEVVEEARDYWHEREDWDKFKSRMVARITNHEPMSGRIERADNSIIDFAIVPLPDGAVMMSYIDVTDTIRVERALRERNEALRTADQMKSDFISTVSRELTRPLDHINGEADRLIPHLQGNVAQSVETIRAEAQSMLALVDDMRDLATLGSGQVALELDTVDPRRLLRSLEALTRARLAELNVSLRLYCSRNIGWMIADERRLKQALFILVTNVLRTAPEGSEVSVVARRRGEDIDISISLSDEAPQPMLFEGLREGESPSARRALGMAMVRAVVEIHGGRVKVSRDGHEISCILPAGEESDLE